MFCNHDIKEKEGGSRFPELSEIDFFRSKQRKPKPDKLEIVIPPLQFEGVTKPSSVI